MLNINLFIYLKQHMVIFCLLVVFITVRMFFIIKNEIKLKGSLIDSKTFNYTNSIIKLLYPKSDFKLKKIYVFLSLLSPIICFIILLTNDQVSTKEAFIMTAFGYFLIFLFYSIAYLVTLLIHKYPKTTYTIKIYKQNEILIHINNLPINKYSIITKLDGFTILKINDHRSFAVPDDLFEKYFHFEYHK